MGSGGDGGRSLPDSPCPFPQATDRAERDDGKREGGDRARGEVGTLPGHAGARRDLLAGHWNGTERQAPGRWGGAVPQRRRKVDGPVYRDRPRKERAKPMKCKCGTTMKRV